MYNHANDNGNILKFKKTHIYKDIEEILLDIETAIDSLIETNDPPHDWTA